MAGSAYLQHLGSVPLFSSCTSRDLQKIAKASDEVTIDEGKVLVEQDAIGHEFFVIVEGSAQVTRNGHDVATMGPGDYFGELALFDGGPRTATVTATSPMRVLVLGQREFAGLLDEVPGLTHKVLATLARRIRDLDDRIFP
jgi:CRP-like cAMP-binding protein